MHTLLVAWWQSLVRCLADEDIERALTTATTTTVDDEHTVHFANHPDESDNHYKAISSHYKDKVTTVENSTVVYKLGHFSPVLRTSFVEFRSNQRTSINPWKGYYTLYVY